MANETQPTSLVRTSSGEIIVPTKQLLFTVLGRTSAPVAEIRRQFLDIITQEPIAIRRALATVYENPELFVQTEPRRVTLDEIQKNFPLVVEFFTPEILTPILKKNPSALAQIAEEKVLLEEAGEQVKDIELTLKVMIENGNVGNLTLADYQKVISSHSLYGDMIVEFKKNQGKIKFGETDRFVAIGQNLLITKRLFEFREEDADTEYKQSPKSRSTDYKGKLAQLQLMSIFMGNLKRIDPDNIRFAYLKESFYHLLGETQLKHPDKFKELDALFDLPDVGKMSRWVQMENEANFDHNDSQAERIGYLHGASE